MSIEIARPAACRRIAWAVGLTALLLGPAASVSAGSSHGSHGYGRHHGGGHHGGGHHGGRHHSPGYHAFRGHGSHFGHRSHHGSFGIHLGFGGHYGHFGFPGLYGYGYGRTSRYGSYPGSYSHPGPYSHPRPYGYQRYDRYPKPESYRARRGYDRSRSYARSLRGYGRYPVSGRDRSTGQIDLRSEPAYLLLAIEPVNATVYLDGRYLGTAGRISRDATLLIDAGAHELEVKHPSYENRVVDFTVEPGKEIELQERLGAELGE